MKRADGIVRKELGAMGIAVGYFVPHDDSKMAALRRKTPPMHEMAGMTHDH